MAESDDIRQQTKQRKITRKEVAEMSTREFFSSYKVLYLRLLGYLKPYKARFTIGVVFGVLSGLFNGVLILAFRMVFKVVLPSGPDSPAPDAIRPFEGMPFWSDWVIPRPEIAANKEWVFVLIICLTIPLLLLVRGLLSYVHQYCMIWVGSRVLYQLRDETFSGLLYQSLSFFNKIKQGELMMTVFNQTRIAASAATDLAAAFVKHPFAIFSVITVLMFIEPVYTIGALVVFPLCILPIILISQRIRKAGGNEEEEAAALMVTMQESFSGIRVVQSHAREDYEREKFNEGSRQLMTFIMRWRKGMELAGPMVETVASIGLAIGLAYAWRQKIDAGTFLVLNMAMISIYPHAKALSKMQIQLQKCLLATSRVFAFMDTDPEVADAPNAIELKNAGGAISFEGVRFAYKKGIQSLESITVDFETGKKYALVGQSGVGKSTMISLLMRFYDPDEGRITLDGRDIREYTQHSLRDQIGLVSQENFLFHASIYDNIRYGRLDASRGEIEHAAKLAQAHDFIIAQEDGYATELGDRGCTLSGGQQQRISIARAILRNAPILLLDEAYASLDSESEKKIQDALDVLAEGKTVIAVAHRLSTVLNADQIVVLKSGRVLDRGTHPELLERCGEYQELHRLQFKAHEAELAGTGA